jgi:hypothetical protein
LCNWGKKYIGNCGIEEENTLGIVLFGKEIHWGLCNCGRKYIGDCGIEEENTLGIV